MLKATAQYAVRAHFQLAASASMGGLGAACIATRVPFAVLLGWSLAVAAVFPLFAAVAIVLGRPRVGAAVMIGSVPLFFLLGILAFAPQPIICSWVLGGVSAPLVSGLDR